MSEQIEHRQIQFGVFFQGVNFGTIWSHEHSGEQMAFDTFRRVAQTAERGLFSTFFLGEGLRLREHLGNIHQLDIAGRPDAQTQLAALAAVTEQIGLVTTQNTTFNDPADIAYRLASLDILSGGRAAWNIVTTDNAWTGANFRRGAWLDTADRYRRAAEFVEAAGQLWSAWAGGAVSDSTAAESWASPGTVTPVEFEREFTRFTSSRVLPATAQTRPVLFQAGDSDEGRDFAVRHADVVFSAHHELEDATEFANDIRVRLARTGRRREELLLFPSQVIILDATDAAAEEKARWVRHAQITPQTAIAYLEQIWGKDLSHYDPDGPLPAEDPVLEVTDNTRGVGLRGHRSRETAQRWRAESEQLGLSIREFVISVATRKGIVGSYATAADRIGEFVASGAVDGFNISPYLVPDGLDDIVDHLIPELQERGLYRTEYPGLTLRDNLGLPAFQHPPAPTSLPQKTPRGEQK